MVTGPLMGSFGLSFVKAQRSRSVPGSLSLTILKLLISLRTHASLK